MTASLFAMAEPAYAFEPFAFLVPCRATAVNDVGTERPCITCHNNADGGSGCATPPCFNAFGTAFNTNTPPRTWNALLAMGDADGDGYTNGEELGDPEGTWTPGMGLPSDAICACATRPGFDTFTPGDTDADGDGVCCRGSDNDMNGSCTAVGEHDAAFDCNDGDATANSSQMELCTDVIDNDCDGLATLSDPECEGVVDRDGDGFCAMGRDTNNDHDCIDAGEITADVDCDDAEITVFPGAREHCADGRDNDCNGAVDEADAMCTSDVDADDDGYCPIGRDANDNGNCNDGTCPGPTCERELGIDCDDSNPLANPMQSETGTALCSDGVDNDCNGIADFRDSGCATLFDEDGDGYCPTGQDTNGDGDCADTGEDNGAVDCDDENPQISPGMAEICTNGAVDDDCDGDASLADADCAGYLDTDGDRYCFVGFDANRDGSCIGATEETGDGDCDDTDPSVNPSIDEICTDTIDNDCDGVGDALDRDDCDLYVDHDRDGWCLVGQDMNDDGDCADTGEQGGPTEVPGADGTTPPASYGTDNDPTVYPGAPENCRDMRDNDLDGVVDNPDYCTRDMDYDGDGYCPIGQDLNGDGDCLDADENQGVSDCNESDTAINPGAEEQCRELVDYDCDGRWQTMDTDCFHLLDRDGDGFCGVGLDDNGDGDCTDTDEDRFGADCDDDDAAVNARARETCDDGIDNDCDGNVDFADTQCTCDSDAVCADGDSCTRDMCVDRRCTWTPDPTCGDGGVLDGGPGGGDDGCSCRASAPSAGSPAAFVWLLGVALAILRGRRRRR